MGNYREASIGLAVPEEAICHNGDVVGGPLPFAYQNGSRSRERSCQGPLWPLGSAVEERAIEKSAKFPSDWPREAAVKLRLSRIGDCEGENVASKTCRRPVAKLALPKTP
jgi:hypothetical protein